MEDFLKKILTEMVVEKDSLAVEVKESFSAWQVTVRVAESDCGTIVGKGGATIRSIRDLLGIWMRKHTPDQYRQVRLLVNPE